MIRSLHQSTAVPVVPSWVAGPGDEVRAREEIRDVAGLPISSGVSAADAYDRALLELSGRNGELRAGGLRLVWASASLGYPRAVSRIADEIAAWASEPGRTAREEAAASRALEAWDGAASRRLDVRKLARDNADDLVVDDDGQAWWVDRGPAFAPGPVALRGASAAPPAVAAGPEDGSVVVVPSVGDAGSRDGAETLQRYAHVVGRALPPAGRVPDAGAAAAAILARWPWATRPPRHVEGELALLRGAGATASRLRPILLVGPPGGGKTSLARGIASVLGVRSVLVPTAGSGDSAGLGAMPRGWSTARPCAPVIAAAETGTCNPMVVIDELDKSVAMGSRNGSVAGTLLGMLGEQSRYTDACLMTEVDLSRMTFVATANDIEAIPEAVLDRFRPLPVGRPAPEHFDVVLANLRDAEAASLGVPAGLLPWLDAREVAGLRAWFAECGGSLRETERAYRHVLAAAAEREAEARSRPN